MEEGLLDEEITEALDAVADSEPLMDTTKEETSFIVEEEEGEAGAAAAVADNDRSFSSCGATSDVEKMHEQLKTVIMITRT